MSFGIPEVFLGLAIGVYIYILIDRVCKSFEQCSLNKSMGSVYSKLSPNWLNDLIKKKVEQKES